MQPHGIDIKEKMKKLICLITMISIVGCSSLPITPMFGMRFQQPYPAFVGGGFHDGLDIDVPLGTQVRSIADGFVSIATTWDIRGNSTNVVMIRHDDGTLSKYIHIDNVTVTRDLVPYSFRHYFITDRINRGATPTQVAETCGTSTAQIEKTYYHTSEAKMITNALPQFEYKDGLLIPK